MTLSIINAALAVLNFVFAIFSMSSGDAEGAGISAFAAGFCLAAALSGFRREFA